ncbi:MAG: PIN domain-containing protein [archaeon YNP-WB-062]|jgi:predicted nucleic acid-binding protein|nr:PIN domain-containing protein [Candidatus Culexarchaeum yellowstonense]
MLRGSSAYYPEGVIDVSVIVVSLFRNPLQEVAVNFLSEVLLQRKRIAIPIASILGGFHIATRYLKLPAVEVKKALVKMLETRSSAFYPYISLEDAIDAIDYATYYKVESWDGYIIRLAKNIGNNIVYTLDEDLKKVRDVIVLNPFPKELIEQYHEYIKRKTAEKQRY